MEYFEIGMVFTQDLYDEAYNWLLAQENPYYSIEEKDSEDSNRQFILVDKTPTLVELNAQEKKRIANLRLTGADVERGIYQAKGIDFDDIVAMVSELQPEGLDIKALKIELKANHFYRGNPYVNAVGALLGFSSEMLDAFFETGLLQLTFYGEETENKEVHREINEIIVVINKCCKENKRAL